MCPARSEAGWRMGYPVAIWEQMPDIASDAFPVAFGNFRRGYLMTSRGAMRMTVDEVTTPGFTKFYLRRRVGGIPLNNNAVKFIRTVT